jgi:hypothetical protein
MKYAIKLELAEDDWIYITEDTPGCTNLIPLLFDTKHDAKRIASTWKPKNTKVVEYND